MVYGKFRGNEGVPEISSRQDTSSIADQQIWRILKSHASFLEVQFSASFHVVHSVEFVCRCYRKHISLQTN